MAGIVNRVVVLGILVIVLGIFVIALGILDFIYWNRFVRTVRLATCGNQRQCHRNYH